MSIEDRQVIRVIKKSRRMLSVCQLRGFGVPLEELSHGLV